MGVFALHHRAVTGRSAFRAEPTELMGLVLSAATRALSCSPSASSGLHRGCFKTKIQKKSQKPAREDPEKHPEVIQIHSVSICPELL